MKKIKYFMSVVFTAFITLLLSSSVCADELLSFDIKTKCSITISLIPTGWEDDAVKGAEVTIYKVADIDVKKGKIVYKYCDDFINCGYDLDNPEDPKLSWSIYTFAVENRIKGVSLLTDNRGDAVFQELDPGLYLGAETMSVKNYCDFSPFLLSLPMAENDRWIYNVSAAPKIEIERFIDLTVNKFWNDSGKNRPESVKVQLFSERGVYDTVTLYPENNWSYTWELIPYIESFSIRELDVPKGYTATYERDGFTFNVYNTGGDDDDSGTTAKNTTVTTSVTGGSSTTSTGSSTLIQTGQLKWPVPVLICCGTALIAAGLFVISSGGKDENKK